MSGPPCGNNPHHQLTPGDAQAVAEFRAYLTARAQEQQPVSLPDRPAALDGLLGYVADSLPDQAANEAKARAAIAPLEKAIREAKAQERAELRGATLAAASKHLRTTLFPATYEDAGQKTAEGVTRAADELLRIAAANEQAAPTPREAKRWYQPRPIEIEAVQWTGDNAEELGEFAGPAFNEIPPEDRTEDTEATAQIADFSEWRLLCPGDWVIRRGEEFEPMGREEFAETYEPARGPS